jgi:prepilin-type N-terminal cleavage/methylation domain-containing protein/prepilin-type processing-associated H-X9-DG protein
MKRRGFTLIELLVVIGIICILISLLGPAVQMAREGMRGLECRTKLRNFALATHQYLDVHGMFPGYFQIHNLPKGGLASGEVVYRIHAPSIFAQILPFLGQSGLYDSINFGRLGTADNSVSLPDDVASNMTARETRSSLFVCPSDYGDKGVNYRACFGVGPATHRTLEFPDSANGLFGARGIAAIYPVTSADISDGLSKTAAFSERPVGTGHLYTGHRATPADKLAAVCLAASLKDNEIPTGEEWLYSGITQTLYTHALPPNSSIQDCFNIGIRLPYGASTARSNHGSTVNVAMGDGSVLAISDSISILIWRALATRDDGDGIGGSL